MLDLDTIVSTALAEDVGHGDLTTGAVVPPGARCRARVVAKEDGVLSGVTVFRRVFETLGGDFEWQTREDGQAFEAGDTLAEGAGPAAALLTGERVALNFLQRLSGVATMTAAFVHAVEGTGCRICDTRKTTPLLRALEKHAVRHGGGHNHRFGLFDAIMIKENHIAAAGGVEQAVSRAKAAASHMTRIQVEVESLEEFEEALAAGPDCILLDNMGLEEMREAVSRLGSNRVTLEASGNMTLERVRLVAETGVHFISVGALTHSARAIDLSMLIEQA